MRNTCRIRRMVSLCAGIHPSIDCEARSRCEVDADPSGDVTPTRPNIGKVADFRSEWWPLSNRNGGPTSNRNAGRLHLGMGGRIKSESAADISGASPTNKLY